MKKTPFALYRQYLQEKEKAIINKDFTYKTYKELQTMKKQLQKMGLLPVNQKWKGL